MKDADHTASNLAGSLAYLVITRGLPPRVITVPLGTSIAGRAAGAEIELRHVEVSRQHCRFKWDGDVCVVEDLGSVRGTAVNGQPITGPTQISPGDAITIGVATLIFGLGETPAIGAAPSVSAARMLVAGLPTDTIEVTGELTLGREPGLDVWLDDPAVSRRHAMVRPQPGGGCVVTDLHSTAGTFVNGHRFDEHELTVGDRLQIGPFCFQFDGHALTRIGNSLGGAIRVEGLTARANEQVILDDVTVAIPASRFVGIIGPSGAGKSTFLHSLSGIREPQAGHVTIDGRNVYAWHMLRSFGFVPQEDIVHLELTVMEALRFAARLRLPAGTPELELQKLILQTLTQLGLSAHARKPIARLSGGQRKRVSVGVELLAKPAVLFLDEPSSGLDPATEFQLMELLRDLADTGCTIVCTTHVMEHAYLMDQLIVLAGGCLVFQGTSQEVRENFGVNKLAALYDRLLERPPLEWKQEFNQGRAPLPEPAPLEPGMPANLRRRRALALPILLHRQWAILRADWRNFVILAGQPLVIGALVSWVSDDRALILFFAYLATLWFGCSNAAQEIVKEIAIYRRERLVGVKVHSYLAAKFLFLTAITALQALLLYGALLLGEGTRDGAVWLQIAALLGTAVAAVGIGSAISACARSVMQAVMIVPLVLIPQIIFSGYTVPVSDMSKAVHAVSRLSPTFSANIVMDTSFLWQRELTGDVISDHHQSYRNLDPDRDFATGDIFNRGRPAAVALGSHAAWAAGTYLVAWLALRRRERK